MKQFFDQLLAFLQQGIAAIFRFIQMIWTWSIDQINKVFQAPWDSWPLWKPCSSKGRWFTAGPMEPGNNYSNHHGLGLMV